MKRYPNCNILFWLLSYSCSNVYPVQQPDVRYSSSRPMADQNTIPYIRVLHWIYITTTGLYSDWSVCSCQNLLWTCQNVAVLKSRDQNPCSQALIAGNQCSWASKMRGWNTPDFLVYYIFNFQRKGGAHKNVLYPISLYFLRDKIFWFTASCVYNFFVFFGGWGGG